MFAMGITLSSPTRSARSRVQLLVQLVRFCLVGGLNTFIDLMIFNILLWTFPTQFVHRLIFYNSLAYLLGAINSFCWNKLWTFEQRRQTSKGEVARFAAVTILGILCNDMLLWLATMLLARFSVSGFLWSNVAKIAAIAGTVALSFVGMRFSVFTQNKKAMVTIPPPSNPHLFITPRSLSVILPAYNEEAVISDTVSTILSKLITWTDDFEIIVVNDGSKDRTGAIVTELSATDSRIRLITHPVNRGYGAALVTGFESVTKETAFFMDSDGQFDISELVHFFPLIEEYDAVLGYRINRQDSWMRKLNAWCWKQLVSFMFGIHVRDVDCAFKLYRSEFFLTHRLETRGAMINTEILYKFARSGYTYTEVGVHHLPRRAGQATGAKPAVILRALRELFVYAGKWYREENNYSQE